MKKSRKIALTLIASACIMASACGSEKQATQRNVYASKDACAKDWGSEECEQDQKDMGTYYGPHYYYYGGRPWYFPMGSGTPVETRPSQGAYSIRSGTAFSNAVSSVSTSHAVSSTARGGFGESSAAHGGGAE